MVEQILDSVQDVRKILDRLSRDEEDDQDDVKVCKHVVMPQELTLTTDNKTEESEECRSATRGREDTMAKTDDLDLPLVLDTVDSIADLDFEKVSREECGGVVTLLFQVKQALMAEEEATANLRRELERKQSAAVSVPEESDVTASRGQVKSQPRNAPENPPSAIVGGKVDGSRSPSSQDCEISGRSPTRSREEAAVKEPLELCGQNKEGLQGQQGFLNGGSKKAQNKQKSLEQAVPNGNNNVEDPKPAAPWREATAARPGKKPGSRREQQLAQVQEFLSDPSAPGKEVPLEVRLRKTGEGQGLKGQHYLQALKTNITAANVLCNAGKSYITP